MEDIPRQLTLRIAQHLGYVHCKVDPEFCTRVWGRVGSGVIGISPEIQNDPLYKEEYSHERGAWYSLVPNYGEDLNVIRKAILTLPELTEDATPDRVILSSFLQDIIRDKQGGVGPTTHRLITASAEELSQAFLTAVEIT